uniref:Uncharacterized protein n=1 Tax=Panagrolaimus sp. PS1159 TaxID=55785 RepID=A0AC35FF76_9BILA
MPPPPSSSSWNLLGTKIAVGVMLVGAVAWLCYCSFNDSSENIKNREKKDSKKNNQEPQKLLKNDDTKGVSPDDLKEALKKKVTKDGDCISCRELPTTPKKKTPKIPLSSAEGTPLPAAAALPGLNSTLSTPKDADKSFGSTSSANTSWDVLPLPTTPKKKEKNGRDVPPTPANSLTILLKNRKKKEPKSEGATISSSDTRSGDKDEEKTQDDL